MKYILLTPVTPADFCLDTYEEIREAAQEFGCDILMSTTITGGTVAFIMANTKAALEGLCSQVDLEGTVLEYTSVYDQLVKVV
jgi:hypothetical protein